VSAEAMTKANNITPIRERLCMARSPFKKTRFWFFLAPGEGFCPPVKTYVLDDRVVQVLIIPRIGIPHGFAFTVMFHVF
jgi:hypothetical protein